MRFNPFDLLIELGTRFVYNKIKMLFIKKR